MQPITLTFQPTRLWIFRAYGLKNIICKTGRRLNLINIFSVVLSTLFLWVVYRAIHPSKFALWSSEPIGNLMFIGIVFSVYTIWEYARLTISPVLHHNLNDSIGVDIEIGGIFTSYVETTGASTSRVRTFTAKWQDLAELTIGKNCILFTFLSKSSGYQVVMLPRNSLTPYQLDTIKDYRPLTGGIKPLVQWYLERQSLPQLMLDGAGLLVTVILADWVFF